MNVYHTDRRLSGEELLALALQATDMPPAPVLHTAAGKPYCENGVSFNATHTEGLSAIAVGDAAVGLDAERRRPRDLSALLARLAPEEREEDFFRLWTAKEAYIKFRGGTLASMLGGLVFCGGVLYENGVPLPLSLTFLDVMGCTLCVCMERSEEIRTIPLPLFEKRSKSIANS